MIFVSKRQSCREAGTQSHGSSSLMHRDWKIARPPKFSFGGFLFNQEVLPIYKLAIEYWNDARLIQNYSEEI